MIDESKMLGCEGCPLYGHPHISPSGSFDAPLVVIGEAPGAEEAKAGIPFVGQSGQILDALLRAEGFDPANTFRTNVVMCRPPGNREPTPEEIQCCHDRLVSELQETTGTILVLGKVAREALPGLPLHGRKVVEGYHPAYVMRKPSAFGDLRNSIRAAVNSNKKVTPPLVNIPIGVKELQEALDACPDGVMVAFDLETDNVNWYDKPAESRAPVLCMQLCWDVRYATVINDELLYDYPEVVPMLQRFFQRVRTCGHNAKFDAVFLKSAFDIDVHIDFDTMLAHHALDENSMHGLKELAKTLLGMDDWEIEIKQYLRNKNDMYSQIPFDKLAVYGAMDVAVTLTFQKMFEKQLKEQGLYETPFMMITIPAENAMVKVELHGIMTDTAYLEECGRSMQTEIDELAGKAREVVGMPNLNLNSPPQLVPVLYEKLGLPTQYDRKTKKPTTAHEALVALEGKHPFVDLLQKHRRVAKIKSSYVDNLVEMAGLDGRVHPTFLLQGTETGRLAVRDPAAQTIPRASDKYGKMIRRSIIAPPGYKLGLCDFSQAELRVFACLSGDPFLIDVYQTGRDLHSEVAIIMFGEGYTKEQRVICKMFNFAYVYGGTEFSFAKDAGISVTLARELIAKFNKSMPIALKWKLDQLASMRKNGYVENFFGRRRRYPLLTPDNIEDARKSSINMPIQGTASDLTLMAATRAVEEGIHVVLLVHDSIMIEEPDDKIDRYTARIAELMESIGTRFMPQVPWKVDKDIMQAWYAKEED